MGYKNLRSMLGNGLVTNILGDSSWKKVNPNTPYPNPTHKTQRPQANSGEQSFAKFWRFPLK